MDKTAIVYWSGTGNTAAMANAIAKGMEAAGAVADVIEVTDAKVDAIAAYHKIALGCPSMGDEVLEDGDFEPFYTELAPKLAGKKLALFGSYDWGDGQWMRDWSENAKGAGAELFKGEGMIQNLEPDEADCEAYGREFAAF